MDGLEAAGHVVEAFGLPGMGDDHTSASEVSLQVLANVVVEDKPPVDVLPAAASRHSWYGSCTEGAAAWTMVRRGPQPVSPLPKAIPGEPLCIRVHGTQVNGRCAIMENIATPGTATPMHFHPEDEMFHILEGAVTFCIDGEVFNASVGSIVVIPAGTHHAWKNRSNLPIRMSTFF